MYVYVHMYDCTYCILVSCGTISLHFPVMLLPFATCSKHAPAVITNVSYIYTQTSHMGRGTLVNQICINQLGDRWYQLIRWRHTHPITCIGNFQEFDTSYIEIEHHTCKFYWSVDCIAPPVFSAAKYVRSNNTNSLKATPLPLPPPTSPHYSAGLHPPPWLHCHDQTTPLQQT